MDQLAEKAAMAKVISFGPTSIAPGGDPGRRTGSSSCIGPRAAARQQKKTHASRLRHLRNREDDPTAIKGGNATSTGVQKVSRAKLSLKCHGGELAKRPQCLFLAQT